MELRLKVAVVNRALAKQFFPNEDPIGKTFSTDDGHDGRLIYQIVGVCADARYASLREEAPPIFYLTYRQTPDLTWGMTYVVRARISRSEITNSLKQAVQSIDRDLPLTDIYSLPIRYTVFGLVLGAASLVVSSVVVWNAQSRFAEIVATPVKSMFWPTRSIGISSHGTSL